jgi:hypothetical protein
VVTSGVTVDRLALVAACSLLAGIVMGVAADAITGVVPIIGALYGVVDPLVGWTTHLFHSLVFGWSTQGPPRLPRPASRLATSAGWRSPWCGDSPLG